MNNKSYLFAGILLLLLSSCGPANQALNGRPRNLILLISDGCGPASFTMTREFERLVGDGGALAVDPHLVGTVRTFPSDTRLADSAASGTAFACAIKTKKGYVGVDDDGQPVGTLVEAAEKAGIWTGLITTSGITDATPAAFSAHITNRDLQNEIAPQQIHQGIGLLLGGGRIFFQTRDQGGRRDDGVDQIAEARNLGYQYVSNRDELLGSVHLPLLGLFAADHMALEIDRDETDQPSLSEMLQTALALLSESPKGFILVVETEGTDDAGHDNDAAADLREVLSYDSVVSRALDFARKDGKTLVVSTSDHDTGGLAIGIGGYEWTPEVLAPVKVSAARFVQKLRRTLSEESSAASFKTYVRSEMENDFGFSDLGDEAWADLDAMIDRGYAAGQARAVAGAIADRVKREVSARAGLGWSTGGHTGVDTNLYSYGPGNLLFRGNLDNTEVGARLAEVMNLNTSDVTRALRTPAGN